MERIDFYKCPYCGKQAEKANGTMIYPERPDLKDLKILVCWPCDARVGCHKKSGTPLGRLANRTLRRYKQTAHRAFDRLWKDRHMSRSEAYRRLSLKFGVDHQVHIGWMDVEDCKKVVIYTHEIFKEHKDELTKRSKTKY